MPNFQSSINQTLGTLGALATFSPGLQDHAEKVREKRQIKNEEKALNKKTEAATSSDKPLEPQIEEDINKRNLDLAKRRFELNPSPKTYEEYSKLLPKTFKEDPEMLHEERLNSIPDEARRNAEYDYNYRKAYDKELASLNYGRQLDIRRENAMSRVGSIAEAKAKQKRNFMEYLRKQPISLGGTNSGTIGDLPKEAQRQIASQYTRGQRKTMMDRMDEEAKKNGK